MFNDIIEAYQEVNRMSQNYSGQRLQNLSKLTNNSWVYVEVIINTETNQKADIISFYNQIFLDRMKAYIIATKSLTLEQGARTPILNKSNF